MLTSSSRAPLFLVLTAVVLILPSCGSEPAPPHTPPDRPNIILVSLDTLRPDHLDLYGYHRETAPSLAKLAEQSLVFDNAFSQAPKTAPSHMSLFTGLYPTAHGVQNLDEADNRAVSPEIPLMAEMLRAAGYVTAGFTGGGHMGPTLGFDRGFETFETGGSQFRRAADWVRSRSALEPPFFLLVHTYSVHDPYLSPERFQVFNDPDYSGQIVGNEEELIEISGEDWENQHQAFWARVDPESEEDRARLVDLYNAAILATDFQLNQFLGTLQQAGVFEDALLIVLSDHGEEFQEHGGYLHESLYEENLKVPLMIRFPGSFGAALAGARVASTVRLIDVLPTLLEYIGLEGAERLQGKSFLPALDAPERALPREVLSEWPRQGHRALRLGDWKLIVRPDGDTELYRLDTDPAEADNLAADEVSEVQRLEKLLAGMVAESEGIRAVVTGGEAQEIDPEVRKQLEALGYIE